MPRIRAFIRDLARTYFIEHRRHFGRGARFRDFLLVDACAPVENRYPTVVRGYIMYAQGGTIRASRPLRVHYYQSRGSGLQRATTSRRFASESVFHSRVWPAVHCPQPLVTPFHAAGEYVSPALGMGALVLDCDPDLRNWGYRCHLDYRHLQLMATRIGWIHGRILTARADPQKLEALPVDIRPRGIGAQALLERCLQPLEWDARYHSDWRYRNNVQRLGALIETLDDWLAELPDQDSPTNLICHRNYSQACGFFRYQGRRPVDVQIGCWANVGFDSLGVDLVNLIFVDADADWSFWTRIQLVAEYYDALRHSCPSSQAPSWQQVWAEIRNQMPVALYALAARVQGYQEHGKRHNWSGRWDEEFVTKVFRNLISCQLIQLI